MTKKTLITTLAAALTLSLFTGVMTGCGSRSAQGNVNLAQEAVQEQAEGGVISVKVNPEIAVSYDEQGLVTKIEGRNDDGKTIAADYTEYEGKDCRQVIYDLVAKIDGAGYLVEETEGEGRQITLEIEAGSILPSENFLSNIVAGIQEYTGSKNLNASVAVDGESNYGWTNYGDTDYGPDNDGVTDYGNSDYGPNNDGVTNYDDNGTTNYDDGGNTNYDDNGTTNYDDGGDTNYDDNGTTDYDDGNSGYED